MSNDTETRTLLVIEDEPDIREVVVAVAHSIGIKAHEAEDGLAALKLLEHFSFDAIITDIRMPNMTGLEFLSRLRERGNETPVVVLSAFGDKASTVTALRLGATDFLEKPCDLDHLKQIIKKISDLGSALKSVQATLSSIYDKDGLPQNNELRKLREAKKAVLSLQVQNKLSKK